ncbi:MAG: DUF4382 domain-containing protein, partial [Methanomicrobiales archaeon]|nr:DUF4382 domain-containing protein [Methanomicrobiales archaeon]
MKHSSLFLLMVCLVGGFVILSGCTTSPGGPNVTPTFTAVPTTTGDPLSCTGDADCVPAQCCHPESCINKQFQPDCSAVLCSAACLGPLDCGAGHCRCSEGKCQVVPGPGPVVPGQATLIIAVKDAPKVKDGDGTITHLLLNISEVSVQKAAPNQTITQTDDEVSATESGETDTAGWITVINETQSVDLLQFVNVSKVLGEKTLDAGTYTQIRLKIDSGTITVDGTDYSLTVPSGVLKLNRGFVLVPNETRMLTLDFNMEKSVVSTGSDKYMLKP